MHSKALEESVFCESLPLQYQFLQKQKYVKLSFRGTKTSKQQMIFSEADYIFSNSSSFRSLNPSTARSAITHPPLHLHPFIHCFHFTHISLAFNRIQVKGVPFTAHSLLTLADCASRGLLVAKSVCHAARMARG